MRIIMPTVAALTLIVYAGCQQQTASAPTSSVLPEDSFTVAMPTAENWEVLQQGPLGTDDQTYVHAVADRERQCQLSVIVLPQSADGSTWDVVKLQWEKGFTKKASRKISSDDIKLAGRDAYQVVTSVNGPDGTAHEVVGIFLLANGRSYTLATLGPEGNAADDPEFSAFLESFRIVEGQ